MRKTVFNEFASKQTRESSDEEHSDYASGTVPGCLCGGQTVVYPEKKQDPNRTLVFLPDKDVAPPYNIEGYVDHRGLSEIIRISINGFEVIPDASRPLPNPEKMPAPSPAEVLFREVGQLQIEMEEKNCSYREIYAAAVGRFESSPDVAEVNPIDSVSMEIVFRDGSKRIYIASPDVVSTERGMLAIIKGFEFKLEHGYALLFSSANTLYIKPNDYELFLEELAVARSADIATLSSREWKVLTPKVAVAIGEGREAGK